MDPSRLILTTLREILDGRLTKKKQLPTRLTNEEHEFCERSLELINTVGDLPKLNKWLEAYESINP
ncbi:MAG: hypothetical protein M0R06_13105 [Sphaerochaeta sp.]|jgi:hypothetical protein|nr:hypothetical protein [Sphaerochaeta sp.]MDD2730606.1 hypothetical protein [Candidatus Portnoybacteria bacterium]